MSQISRGIFAAVAVTLTLGAVPLAAGRDLTAGLQNRLERPCDRDQSRRQGRSRRRGGTRRCADPHHFTSTGWSFRYVGPGPRSRGASGPQTALPRPHGQIREWQADGRLRARRQRADRSRQIASTRPLRDLSGIAGASRPASPARARFPARRGHVGAHSAGVSLAWALRLASNPRARSADRQNRDQLFDADGADHLNARGNQHGISQRGMCRRFRALRRARPGLAPGLALAQHVAAGRDQVTIKNTPAPARQACKQSVSLEHEDKSRGAKKRCGDEQGERRRRRQRCQPQGGAGGSP